MSATAIVVTPMSRRNCRCYYRILSIVDVESIGGSVSLKTSNPFDQPLIDPALLTHDFDRFAFRELLRLARKFVSSPAWKDYILNIYGALASVDFDNDSELDEHLKDQVSMGLHAVGSASMSPRGAHWGVTDPDLKVKGVRGIRVVDASVFVELNSFLIGCALTRYHSVAPHARSAYARPSIYYCGKSSRLD